MTKFTKISAAALFALFLTACDKPAEKAPEAKPEAPAATQPQQPAEAQQQTAAPAQTEAAPAVKVAPLSAEEKADYDKVVEWNKVQQTGQVAAQQKLQQELEAATQAKDEKKVAAAINEFNQNIQTTIKNLDGLEVKSDLIKALKAKTKEVLELSSSLLVEQSKLATVQPTEEQIKAYQEKANVLQNALAELQKQSVELEARVAAK